MTRIGFEPTHQLHGRPCQVERYRSVDQYVTVSFEDDTATTVPRSRLTEQPPLFPTEGEDVTPKERADRREDRIERVAIRSMKNPPPEALAEPGEQKKAVWLSPAAMSLVAGLIADGADLSAAEHNDSSGIVAPAELWEEIRSVFPVELFHRDLCSDAGLLDYDPDGL